MGKKFELTQTLQSKIKTITYLVLLFVVFQLVHYYSLEQIDIYFSFQVYYSIILILCFSPIISVLLMFTKIARQGATILLGIVPGELLYILYSRFNTFTPLTRNEQSFLWYILYESSFGLILVFEVLTFWLVLHVLRELYKQSLRILDISKKIPS